MMLLYQMVQNSHMLDVKHTLLHLLGHSEGCLMSDLTDAQLNAREEISRTLASVADRVLPGISRLKGTALYQLYLTYQQRGINWHAAGDKSKRDILASFNV